MNRFLKPLKKNISQIIITAYSLILVMMILIGSSSIFGMEQLNKVNELSEDSYKVLMQMKNMKESMARVEAGIREHFYGNSWKSHTDESMGSSAFFNMENQQLNVDIHHVGQSNPWSIQVFQGSFTLDQNKNYKLSFDALSTIDRSIQLIFQNSVKYHRHYTETINLTNKMQTQTVYFQMENKKDVLTQLVFALGNVSGEHIVGRHRVMIDNVSLVEVDTGRQLLYNGEFVSKDVQYILLQTEMELLQAIDFYRAYHADKPKQEDLIGQFDALLRKWIQEKRDMIQGLNLKLELSGNLNADSEVQSYESRTETKMKIDQMLNQVREKEEIRLGEKRREAINVKRLVSITLISIVLISTILCVIIYLYFTRTIIRPIRRMSDLLKTSVENDTSMRKRKSIKDDNVNLDITEIYQLYEHMTNYYNIMNDQIKIDGLTGLTNRATFDHVIGECINNQISFYLVLIDIDHFKKINDTYGHVVGDEVIKLLANHLRSISNDRDLCFRYGGEEFGLLIQGRELGENEVFAVAEQLRIKVAELPNPTGNPFTVSIGISKYKEVDSSPIQVIQRADAALYHSKLTGRNRTTIFN
jgi:diguanylate cyclase (GGDEF)-like protein